MDITLYRLTEPDNPDIVSTIRNQPLSSDNVEFADRLLHQNCIQTIVVLIREGLPSRRYDGSVLKDDETTVLYIVPNYDVGKFIELNLPQGEQLNFASRSTHLLTEPGEDSEEARNDPLMGPFIAMEPGSVKFFYADTSVWSVLLSQFPSSGQA